MISASHNPAHDNGVKIFAADGSKLRDEDEAEIAALAVQLRPAHAAAGALARPQRPADALRRRLRRGLSRSRPDRPQGLRRRRQRRRRPASWRRASCARSAPTSSS
jgi:phosphomannomutase